MISDIIGEWDITLLDKEKEAPGGRFVFLENDGKVVVKDADPESTARPNRVEIEGDVIRFEFLSAGSSRGNTHHNYEIRMHGSDSFIGTRRRGMLVKAPITGQRVGPAPSGMLALTAGAPGAYVPSPQVSGSLAEAKARAAEAAERAALAAAEAAAALAEAEAAAAFEEARRAAERAAAARAAAEPVVRTPVAPEVLATLPAPTDPPAFVPMAPVAQMPGAPAAGASAVPSEVMSDDTASVEVVSGESDAAGDAADTDPERLAPHAPGRRMLTVTHRLTHGVSAVLAAEAFPGVFVWGGTFAAPEQRLREAGWEITPVETDESIELDGLLIQHAAMIRDSVSS